MYTNSFSVTGKIEEIGASKVGVSILLSKQGPIKNCCRVEIANPELVAIVLQKPNGFVVGDVVCLSGQIALDESTGHNVLQADKRGVARISRATAPVGAVLQPPGRAPSAKSAAIASPTTTPKRAPKAKAAQSVLPAMSGFGSASPLAHKGYEDDDARMPDYMKDPVPVEQLLPMGMISNSDYDDDVPF